LDRVEPVPRVPCDVHLVIVCQGLYAKRVPSRFTSRHDTVRGRFVLLSSVRVCSVTHDPLAPEGFGGAPGGARPSPSPLSNMAPAALTAILFSPPLPFLLGRHTQTFRYRYSMFICTRIKKGESRGPEQNVTLKL
jgi:hypothetical protein